MTVCLVILHGCSHVSSEVTSGRCKENDAAARTEEQADGIARAVGGGVGMVVRGDDRKIECEGKDLRKSAKGDGKATELVDEGAGKIVDDTGEDLAKVGECSGIRFKKCR